MPKRNLLFKLAIAAMPSLLILGAMAVWLAMPRSPRPENRGAAPRAPDAGGEMAPAAAGGAAAVSESALEPVVRPLAAPSAGGAIGGAVLDPAGTGVAGAEVFLIAIESDGGEALASPAIRDPDDDADGSNGFASLTRRLETRLEASPRSSTSSDGSFRFADAATGVYRVAARAAGLLPDVSDPMVIDEAGAPAAVTLALRTPASVRGVVASPDGSPIEGAEIDAAWSEREARLLVSDPLHEERVLEALLAPRSGTSRSGAAGRFEIGGLFEGGYDLEVAARGFAAARIADAPARETAIEIVLRPEAFLRGEVVDAEGRPIAGAELRLFHLAADANDVPGGDGGAIRPPPRDRAREMQSGADGRFSFGGLARGAYRVEAERAGYLRAVAPLVLVDEPGAGETSLLTLRMEDGHRIWGLVRAAGGAPIANARVRARYQRPIPPQPGDGVPRARRPAPPANENAGRLQETRSAATGPDGAFDISGLPAGLYRLEVSSKDHRDRTLDDLPTDGERIEVELEAGAALAGSVADRRSGEPVPGAAVSHRPGGSAPRRREVRTDADGRFRIDGLDEAGGLVRVEAEGYQTLEAALSAAEGGEELALSLERSGSIGGRVHTGSGSAVERLRVTLLRLLDSPPAAAAKDPQASEARDRRAHRVGHDAYSDAEGAYRIAVPEAGSYQVLVQGRPFAAARSRVVEVPDAAAQIEGVDVSVQHAATVRGVVVGQDQRPIAGARVRALPAREPDAVDGAAADAGAPAAIDDAGETFDAAANAAGEFEIAGLGQGAFRLLARAPGFINARSEVFELGYGGAHAAALVLEPELAISGLVLSPEGDPLPLAELRAEVQGESDGEYWSRERTVSSALGTFRLGRLGNRLYDVRVLAEGYAPALAAAVPAGTGDLRIQLEHLVAAAGKVVGAYSGQPVADFRLRLAIEDEARLSGGERTSIERWREFRSSDGAFSIDGLPPGRYVAEVQAPGHFYGGPFELELKAVEGLQEAVLPLVEIGLIGGWVIDGRGNPVGGARVQALKQWRDPASGVVIYEPYSPSSRGPASGARRDGDAEGAESGEDRAGGGGSDGARGGRGGPERSGRSGRSGRAERSATPGRATTDGDGSFFLPGLEDGIYRLTITHDDFVAREVGDYTIENGSGGAAAIGVRAFLASGATLLGSVRSLAEAEGGALSITLSPAPGDRDAKRPSRTPRKTARLDEAGRFAIRGLEPGTYTLSIRYRRASDGSFASLRRTVEIHDADRERGIAIDLSR
jgi:hypothetical protein